jgi:hypothetical protein
VTLLVDAFSRRILAAYLTFDPPGYRSCMMVLRDCVRPHARLPQFVVVDGGPPKPGYDGLMLGSLVMYQIIARLTRAAQFRAK